MSTKYSVDNVFTVYIKEGGGGGVNITKPKFAKWRLAVL